MYHNYKTSQKFERMRGIRREIELALQRFYFEKHSISTQSSDASKIAFEVVEKLKAYGVNFKE